MAFSPGVLPWQYLLKTGTVVCVFLLALFSWEKVTRAMALAMGLSPYSPASAAGVSLVSSANKAQQRDIHVTKWTSSISAAPMEVQVQEVTSKMTINVASTITQIAMVTKEWGIQASPMAIIMLITLRDAIVLFCVFVALLLIVSIMSLVALLQLLLLGARLTIPTFVERNVLNFPNGGLLNQWAMSCVWWVPIKEAPTRISTRSNKLFYEKKIQEAMPWSADSWLRPVFRAWGVPCPAARLQVWAPIVIEESVSNKKSCHDQ
ncbi:hypothetical protein BC940DRAFT_359195 [Gongronella butleri]|nr:hypothetical protein BC940DRAFT_359195 [Gongronella butleri]